MKTSHPDQALNYYETAGNLRSGTRTTKPLLVGEEAQLNNYKMSYGGGEEGSGDSDWTTPRHRHNFEQFRHPIKGDYSINKDEVLPAGWVAYFPESAYYGPQIKAANLTMVSIQFGGPSGLGYWSVAQRKRVYQEMVKTGKLEDGVYSWIDNEGKRHNQDAAEAAWERIFNRKIEYPEGRYRDVVMMNPAAYGYVKDKEATGVGRKILGTFTERRAKVGFIALDKGARLQFGTEDAPEAMFLKVGSLDQGANHYPALSAFSSTAAEAPTTLVAAEPSELYYIKLPTF